MSSASSRQRSSKKRFRVGTKLGNGAFGELYRGVDSTTGDDVAIKLEPADARHPQLIYEARVYALLASSSGVPRVVWSGKDGDYNVLVMQLLGPNLEQLLTQCGRRLSVKTVLMLAESLLNRVETLHKKGIVHRDIKPDNFVLGLGEKSQHLYMIDYGLAKAYVEPASGSHIPFRSGKSLTGTPRYASVNAHRGFEQSRRDDVEALGYVLVYLLRGTLPWMAVSGAGKHARYEAIKSEKQRISTSALCEGLPPAFHVYLKYAKALRYDQEPDYAMLRDLFRAEYQARRYPRDNLYDWDKGAVRAK